MIKETKFNGRDLYNLLELLEKQLLDPDRDEERDQEFLELYEQIQFIADNTHMRKKEAILQVGG